MSGTGACKGKLNVEDVMFPGLMTCAVQVAGSLPKVALTWSCELLTNVAGKVALPAGATPTAGQNNSTCAPLTKPEPLTVNVCLLFEPITGFGDTLLIEGVTVGA